MTVEEKVMEFLNRDMEKCYDLLKEYPKKVPIEDAAELVGCSKDTLRTAIQQFQLIGLAERKVGKQNWSFTIPTAHFLRWYLVMWR